MSYVQIGRHRIGANKPVYIVAEIGLNHNGKIETAKKLIKAASETGANAVKFQKRSLGDLYIPKLLQDSNSAEWNFQYLLPQLKTLELTLENYIEIDKYTKRLGLDLIITPFDLESLHFITKFNLAAIKISSADLTNWPLIQKASNARLPLIVSTGMWNNEEIKRSSIFIKTLTASYVLLHCSSTYPAPMEEINLKYIEKLKEYAPVVGYSGHERGISVCIAAISLGAKLIEKHLTLDPSQSGPDHRASLTPDEFKVLTKEIRNVEKALGEIQKKVTEAELLNKEIFAKSLTVNKDLPKGHILEKTDIIFLSPGKGIPPSHLVNWIGKKLKISKKKYEYLTENNFKNTSTIGQWRKFNFKKIWGVKCRFYDYHLYKTLDTPLVEFHCSDKDVSSSFCDGNKKSALVVHTPEIMGTELFDLCSRDKGRLHKSIILFKKTIHKARQLQSKFNSKRPKIVIHVGGMSVNTEYYNRKKLLNIAEKSLGQIDTYGIDVLPENLPPRPWYLGGQWYQLVFVGPQEMLLFCKSLGLGMTLDICHAQLYCAYTKTKLVDYIKIVLPVVRHIHISDALGIDGEGLQIGEGEIDFDKVFRIFEKINISWVPEIWSGHNNEGAGFYTALDRLSNVKYGL